MSDLPIACTLGPAALKARREDLLGGLVRRAEERIDVPNGYRVRFQSENGLLTTFARFIETERQCCRFLRFDLTVEPTSAPCGWNSPGHRVRGNFSPGCWIFSN